MKTRIYFLDNLRTFLIILVIILHAGLVYESVLENSWIVSDPDKNNTIGLIRMYLDIFVMFAMFFISGYFLPSSVRSKSTGAFLISKFKRILLPWIVSVFTLIPAYKAIFLFSRGMPQEAWYTYFHIFNRQGGNPFFFADNPVQNWLWFLPVLFMFQVVYMLLVKSNLLSFKISLATGVKLTFIFGVIYGITISTLNLNGWYNSAILHFQNERLLIYFMMFMLGTLCYKLRVFELPLNKRLYIISNVVLTISLSIFTGIALNLFFNIIDPSRNFYFISPIVDKIGYYISMLTSMLCLLQIFLHSFRKSLNRSNWILDQLSKNSYFVYIIHVIVIGLVSLTIINFAIPTYVKFLIVVILTFIISNAVVYIYRVLLQKLLSTNIVIITALIAASFLAINISIKQNNQVADTHVTNEFENAVAKPKVGLHMAVIQGDLELVKHHIAFGTDINKAEPSGGSSPLIVASIFGKTEIALALIASGAEINFQNNDGSTPLHTAAFFCHAEIVQALLDNGADKTLQNNSGSTATNSVSGSFDSVTGIYDYFNNTLGPLGLELDYELIKTTRPVIAEMLK